MTTPVNSGDQLRAEPSAMTPERIAADQLMDVVVRYGAARADSAYAARDGDQRASVQYASDAQDALALVRAEVERVTRQRDEALRERDLARPVVRKAQVWRDQFARPTTSTGPRHVALCEAVDTYESAMEALAALPGKPEAPADE